MKPDIRFIGQAPRFWANVKLISEQIGYSVRGGRGANKALQRYDLADIERVYEAEGLDTDFTRREKAFFEEVLLYLNYRAEAIEGRVRPLLMDRAEAQKAYDQLLKSLASGRAPSMNKQKGEKRHPAYLASMVSLIAEKVLGDGGFVDDARRLSVLSRDGIAEVAFSRRYDGAMPTIANPIAVWEIKEYYGTTTFGSRVADGVYETLLDGFEINEGERALGHRVRHFLFVDDRFTWWDCGRSYLCRIVDMLHTSHVDEVFFGREVLTDWEPTLHVLKASL
ncbi:MAG TPA: hypothetical protein VGL58_19310 [Caulobacteraceae bacterium]